MSHSAEQVSFLVGEEKRLNEIIGRAEMEPLLRSALKAGIRMAVVRDGDGLPLCLLGDDLPALPVVRYTLQVEGEPQGELAVSADEITPQLEALVRVVGDALQLTVTNNLKRMLTTELHTSVVQESYDQLVETNRRLAQSERSYRELALELELKVAERTAELRRAYERMLQQEKLAAVGHLAAGMAHEINNPIGFIRSNLNSFAKYLQRLTEMLELYRGLMAQQEAADPLRCQAEQRWRDLKLDFVLEDCGVLLTQSLDGADRVARIVADLKGFAHLEGVSGIAFDPNVELERLLAELAPSFPPDTQLETSFAPLPSVSGHPALLSQALNNVLRNAVQSRANGLRLRITSVTEGDQVVITIADNGCGIPAEQLSHVFEPFFTTRPVGSGTGMGLTVAREVLQGMRGDIELASTEGVGTVVTLRLPIATAP